MHPIRGYYEKVENMNKEKDKDKELEHLKKEVEEIVGKEEIERIRKIVELSYGLDEKPEYKITYNIIGGKDYAIKK